jgi:hypothetical protein
MRQCRDCGATPDESHFATARKPPRRPDRCAACAADPGGVGAAARIVARIEEIAKLRAAGRFRRQEPIHTAPLFAGLPAGRREI